MAKAKKAAKKKSAKKKPINKSSLIAEKTALSKALTLNVTFYSGLGQLTASLFRKGALINMQTISYSGNIFFADTQRGDRLSINGVCSGSAQLVIDSPTSPTTPKQFSAGYINTGFDIL